MTHILRRRRHHRVRAIHRLPPPRDRSRSIGVGVAPGARTAPGVAAVVDLGDALVERREAPSASGVHELNNLKKKNERKT